jgi:hypothetical protein
MTATTLWDQFALRTLQGASPLELAVRQQINLGQLASNILMVDVLDGAYTYAMDDELPITGPRLINEANLNGKGTVRTEVEIPRIYGHDIETDTAQIALQGKGVHARRIRQTAHAIRLELEADFVRGDSSVDDRRMDGLSRRINIGSSQAIQNHATGAGLSLAALDELINEVDAPAEMKRLIIPRTLNPKFVQASRGSFAGTVNFEVNSMGRRVGFYGDVEIITTDVDSQNKPIQGFTEGSSANTCSIYCVAMGEGMVSGLQFKSLDADGNGVPGLVVYDVGESNNTPTMLTRIGWNIGMVIETKRAAARLYNITNAAFTA